MTFEADIIAKFGPLFAGRLWWDELPEATTPEQRQAVFCIVEGTGGIDKRYVDNSLYDFQNSRVTFHIWGARRLEVSAAADALRLAIAESNTATFITMPLGGKVHENNEVLKLRGSRQDFGFWYLDPLATP